MVTSHKFPIAGCGKPLKGGDAISYRDIRTPHYGEGCWITGEYLSDIEHIMLLYPICGSGGAYKVICQECSVAAGLEW